MTSTDWSALDDESRQWLSSALTGTAAPPAPAAPAVGVVRAEDSRAADLASFGEELRTNDSAADLLPLLALAVEMGASDLHLSANCLPHVRVAGRLRPIAGQHPIPASDLDAFLLATLTDDERSTLVAGGDLETALTVQTSTRSARLRASLFRQSGSLAVAFRVVPDGVPQLDGLGLPNVVGRLALVASGLVLVAGKTGSGKSTTLAAMVDLINRERPSHIVTIEDPIEFRHESKSSIVQQRAVGSDTASFAVALRHALRQDPDVIMLGELRDLETIRIALTAAETGHLVLATLHSTDTTSAIHRLIDVFPPDQQAQVRAQLALSLQGIIAQELVPHEGGLKVMAEALVATDAVRNLIRDEKIHQLKSVLESGSQQGMQTMGPVQRRADRGSQR